MALTTETIELKILGLDSFKEMIEALSQWAMEVESKADMTAAEQALYFAMVALDADTTSIEGE
jgi:hypothetical protein